MKVYYAHTEASFGSSQASDDLGVLGALGFNVVDPSWDNIRQVVEDMRYDGRPQSDVDGYLQQWMDGCDGFVFRADLDGTIPTDVAVALARAKDTGKPVLQLPSLP